MAPNFIQEFYKGQKDFAETFRILILQEDENLFQMLDFNEDRPFLEPFLFLYFKRKLTRQTDINITLAQLVFGYIKKTNLPAEFSFIAFANNTGKIYLPRIGYFDVAIKNCPVTILYTKSNKSFTILLDNQKLDYKFTPLKFIKNADIELYQFHDPIFETIYASWLYKENNRLMDEGLPGLNLTPVSLLSQNQLKINRAFEILKNSRLNYFELLNASTKGVYSFQQEGLWSFAAKSAHGNSFICGSPDESLIFFIVELAHQGGHTIFDSIIHKTDQIFLDNPDAPMALLTDNLGDDRTLVGATHGLFTTAKVAEVLAYLYANQDKLKFDRELKHEIVGRLADNFFRHRNGLQKVDHQKVYTKRGLEIYRILDNYLVRIYKRFGDLPTKYQYRRGDFIFEYKDFKMAHPIS